MPALLSSQRSSQTSLRPHVCSIVKMSSALRSSPYVWGVRLVQVLVSAAVLALSGVNISDYQAVPCTIPVHLQYNIAAVCFLSHPLLAYASR